MKAWKAWISSLALIVLVGSHVRPPVAWAADNKELARQHYKKASQLYDLGRFDDALAEYEQAYSLREDPSLLFNMAQACRRKGDLKRALDLYKNYLIKAPDSPMRAEVESRIKALKAQIEQTDKPAEGAPVVPPVAPTPSHGPLAPEPSVAAPTTAPAPEAPAANATTPTAIPSWGPPVPAPLGAPAPVAPNEPVVTTLPAQAQAPATTLPATVPPQPGSPVSIPAAPPTMPPPSYVPPSSPAPVAETRKDSPHSKSPTEVMNSASSQLMLGGATLTVGGVICLGLGVYNAVQARKLSDKVSSGKTFSPGNDNQGKRAERLEKIEGGIGIGAVVVGSTLFTIGYVMRKSERSNVVVVPVVQPDGAMLAATGAF